MKLSSNLLLLLTPLLVTSSASSINSNGNLYISTLNSIKSNLKLTSQEINSILSFSLNTNEQELLIKSNQGDFTLENLFNQPKQELNWLNQSPSSNQENNKIVILLECGDKDSCQDLIPTQFKSLNSIELPSLPLRSWSSVVTLHLFRLTQSLGLTTSSTNDVYGLNDLVKSLKSNSGWKGWVGEELGSAIGWEQLETVKTTVQPDRSNSGLLTDLDLLDSSADTLINELEALVKLVDSKSSPKIVALHLTGMKSISKVHSRTSIQYQKASTLLKQTLTATLASLSSSSSSSSSTMNSNPTMILLTLPPYSAPLLTTRTPWLTPFQSNLHRYIRRAIPSTTHDKLSGLAAPKVPKPMASPVIPSGSTCFNSEAETRNQTDECLGRGEPIKGLTTRGKDCWVCHCHSTIDESTGKTHKWAGEGCEKEDVSNQFVLIFFSSLGLLIVLLASVMLLASAGTGELPGTLASVGGGMSGQSKKD